MVFTSSTAVRPGKEAGVVLKTAQALEGGRKAEQSRGQETRQRMLRGKPAGRGSKTEVGQEAD